MEMREIGLFGLRVYHSERLSSSLFFKFYFKYAALFNVWTYILCFFSICKYVLRLTLSIVKMIIRLQVCFLLLVQKKWRTVCTLG